MQSRMCCWAAVLCATGAAWPAATFGQGSRVISANDNSSGILTDPDIDVLAFHAASSVANVDAAFDTYGSYGKPILISDDGCSWSKNYPDNMHAALDRALARGGHFEHLDPDITAREELGLPVNGIGDFTARSIQHLQYLSQHSQSLSYPGTLTRSGNKLYWNGLEIHLVAFSDYGAVATDLVNIQGYLDVLASYNVNFTRIFALDRWSNQGCNYTPFRVVTGGQPPCRGSKFDITQPNDSAYFTRLRQFVTYAAQKGIVVQYCIFDRCGLQNGDQWRWPANPYNVANNINTRFTLESGYSYPQAFTQTTGDVAVLHTAYLNKIAQTIGDCGNVVYEIMNEPIGSFPNIPGFHSWVADTLRTAFNTNTTQVYDDLGTTDFASGLSRVVFSDGDTTPVTIGGREARQNLDPNSDYYIYFNVSDTFAYQGSKPDLYTTIHYYDTGSGSLTLQYDATGNIYKTGGSVTLTGTNTWKIYMFHVTDAYFGNRQNGGADFRISGGAGNTFYLDVVQVSVNRPQIELAPGSIERSVRRGHSLSDDSFTVTNTGNGTLDYTITDDATWLSESPGSGTGTGEQDTINVLYEVAGLSAGDYSAAITVQDANAANSPQTIPVDLHVWQLADLDGDGDVDQSDFGRFQACFSGPGNDYETGCAAADLDLDPDGDVDLDDLGVFQGCMRGANNTPGC